MSRIVVALGGNALMHRGEPAEAETQRRNVVEAASALAALVGEHELVITHGNGPQVGLLALEADAYDAVSPYPLEVLGAESQGMIGYLLVQALGSVVDAACRFVEQTGGEAAIGALGSLAAIAGRKAGTHVVTA